MEEETKRYILCAKGTSADYLGFGARFIEPVHGYPVVEVSAWNATWQAGRLRSGLCNKGALTYYSTLEALRLDAYGLALLEGAHGTDSENDNHEGEQQDHASERHAAE